MEYELRNYSETDKYEIDRLMEHSLIGKYPRQIVELLYARGIDTKQKLELFIKGGFKDIASLDLLDLDLVCRLIIEAIKSGKVICIMGDYDFDGTCASSIMYKILTALGAKVWVHMNRRTVEGYGLNTASVEMIMNIEPRTEMIITVDNGIASNDAVTYANSLGIDVVVTDHHSQEGKLPNAKAVVNPNRIDCYSGAKELCGASVAFIVGLRTSCHYDIDISDTILECLQLAGYATIADLVPLVGYSRIFAKFTLEELDFEVGNRFIKILARRLHDVYFEKKDFKVNASFIGYYLAPAINALGRLYDNTLKAVDAIINSDIYSDDELIKIADYIIEVNEERKRITKVTIADVKENIEITDETNCVVYQNNTYLKGIVGLAASDVSTHFYLPSLIISKENHNGICSGSARTIEGINIIQELSKVGDLFESLGGHPGAAGFSIRKENIDKLRESLQKILPERKNRVYSNITKVDFEIDEYYLTTGLTKVIESLKPFGMGFAEPIIKVNNFSVDKIRSTRNKLNSFYLGENRQTLILYSPNGNKVIGFSKADLYEELGEPDNIDVICNLSSEEFRGIVTPCCKIIKRGIIKR